MSKLLRLRTALFCSALFVLCVVASQPRLEMGLNDDWAYIWSAHTLADTGRVVYNGWETTMLGWQLYLGAFFIKMAGFSFLAVRLPIFIISALTCTLLQRLFVHLGITEWNAAIGTLTLTLSPIFLPLGYSFMSDVPGLFILLLCIYGCVRAIQENDARKSIAWLVFAALSNAVGGSARQIAWLGVLVVVPCAIWLLRRRKGAAAAGILSLVVSAGLLFLVTRWFKNQPYTITEPILLKTAVMPHFVQPGINLVRAFLAICLLVVPLLSAFLVRYPQPLKRQRDIALTLGVAAAAFFMFVMRHRSVFEALPFGTHYMTARGVTLPGILGLQPLIFPTPVRVVITMLILSSLSCFVVVLFAKGMPDRKEVIQSTGGDKRLDSHRMLILLGPLAAASVGLLVTRSAFFDRYYLPVLVLLSILILHVFETKIGGRLPLLSSLLVAAFAVWGTASMHDFFALGRARLAAAEEIRAAGVPRTEIRGGFEYDGTTELIARGYVNESRIRNPSDAYHPVRPPNYPEKCISWFYDRTPSIKARYVLAHDDSCFIASQFSPITYRTWLPWREQQVLIREVPAVR